jgi:transcriptional regulator with XRE-family HTH domain
MALSFSHREQSVKRGASYALYLRGEPYVKPCYDADMLLKIKEVRIAKRMTVEALANAVGLAKGYVSEIENGKKQCNMTRLQAFAKALGVSVNELIEGASDAETADHLRTMALLSPEDQETVRRVAASLLRKQAGE